MEHYILSLDQGTTSSRAVLVSQDGKMTATAQYPLQQIYPKPGWVEHDPNDILYTIFQSISAVCEKQSIQPGQISAIGITNQRETIVVWEKATGRPVDNALVWQCRRTAQYCTQLLADGYEDTIRQKTGLLIDPYFSATKLKWILDQHPEVRKTPGRYLCGTVDSWLIWNLTGNHVTDHSNASRTMLFDIHNLCWDADLCALFDIPMSLLPKPLPSSGLFGSVKASLPGLSLLTGTPVCGVAGDQQAALFGQGCFHPGMAKNTYGTGCFTLMNTGETPTMSSNRLLTSVAWSLEGKTTYCLEGSAFHGGSAVEWLRRGMQIIDNPTDTSTLARSIPSTDGVYFVPAFTGLGAPYWNSEARAAFFGITQGTGRAHLCRAILESIAFQVADLLATMVTEIDRPILQLRVDGGVSANDFLLQFQSDITGIPVNRPVSTESTALGAAYLAGLAVGLWKSTDQLDNLRKVDQIFQGTMERSQQKTCLAQWHKAVQLTCQF